MTIEVQPIRERDLAKLRRISIETFGATFGPYNAEADLQQHYQRAYNVDQLRRELLNPESQFFFAKIDNEIAGYLKTNVGDAQSEPMGAQVLEVERIYVRPSFQRRGIGTCLIKQAEQLAYAAHKSQIWLGVWENNKKAQHFYQMQGFKQVGDHRFQLGKSEQRDLILMKPVNNISEG
ncbi:GNAT family N-acetyltransferase [Pediococcus acidilactici]|uniref:GNAT family N-acetyltransferase n=1 Tax=Pediococcus acidilactici TaxID=1254 RepID=UPI00194F3870|nr:GNAT family N-acetyltransferase [Pediococcus acidilactici]MBM6585844.1 GNAT family N-acetyltransferase [Pediococcus acidilactici]